MNEIEKLSVEAAVGEWLANSTGQQVPRWAIVKLYEHVFGKTASPAPTMVNVERKW